MENKKVLEKEELQAIIEIQNEYQTLIKTLGNLEVKKIELDIQKKNLKNILLSLKKQETDLLTKLENKYGKGEISLDTGEFISN